jgi:hypothetical protein
MSDFPAVQVRPVTQARRRSGLRPWFNAMAFVACMALPYWFWTYQPRIVFDQRDNSLRLSWGWSEPLELDDDSAAWSPAGELSPALRAARKASNRDRRRK